jgi:hypothetical protein
LKLWLTAREENRFKPNIGEKLDIYKLKIHDSYLSLLPTTVADMLSTVNLIIQITKEEDNLNDKA